MPPSFSSHRSGLNAESPVPIPAWRMVPLLCRLMKCFPTGSINSCGICGIWSSPPVSYRLFVSKTISVAIRSLSRTGCLLIRVLDPSWIFPCFPDVFLRLEWNFYRWFDDSFYLHILYSLFLRTVLFCSHRPDSSAAMISNYFSAPDSTSSSWFVCSINNASITTTLFFVSSRVFWATRIGSRSFPSSTEACPAVLF